MAFMSCLGNCVSCGALFSFNPERVPSIRVIRKGERWVPDPTGTREPICEPCVVRGNRIREEKGMPPIVIVEDAYTAEEVP
jgi:hypothetical protein